MGSGADDELIIREFEERDRDAVWQILAPIVAAGEAYALPREMSEAEVLAYWLDSSHEVFVAEENGTVVGTYYLKANQKGGGDHVANCGYAVPAATRGRGIAGAMCKDSITLARKRAFLAMQFNFVVSSNQGAVHLWEKFGFTIVGCLPRAFRHPTLGLVDAYVMYKEL